MADEDKNNNDESLMSESFLKDFNITEKETKQARNKTHYDNGNRPPITAIITKKEITVGKLFYHYHIEKLLGSGGMGEVYKALDIKNDREVAIKTLKKNKSTINERFKREYKFLNAIDHPNLIKAYDFKEKNNQLFIIMEFVNGKSLKEILQKKVVYSLEEKISIAIQIAQGVEALNLAGIIHRDIKPANIMISTTKVKILDLGLGKDLNSKEVRLTNPEQFIGTFSHMAPEQTESKVTTTTDIFALGTVMYQLFSNQYLSPFHAENQFEIFMKIDRYEPPKLAEFIKAQKKHENVYKVLDSIICQAMKKDPSKRTPNAGIIIRKLTRLYKTINKGKSPSKKVCYSTKNTLKEMRKVHQDIDISSFKEIDACLFQQSQKNKKSNKTIALFIFAAFLILLCIFLYKGLFV